MHFMWLILWFIKSLKILAHWTENVQFLPPLVSLLACLEPSELVWTAAVTGCCIVLHDSCVHKRPWPPDPSLSRHGNLPSSQIRNMLCFPEHGVASFKLPREQTTAVVERERDIPSRVSLDVSSRFMAQGNKEVLAHNLSASEVMWRGGLSALACLLTHTQIRLGGLVVRWCFEGT